MSRRRIILLSSALLALLGCQPHRPTASSSHPASREPLHRVEVVSRSSAELAESLLGRKCRVQLRRDALGMATNTPMPMVGRWAVESSVTGSIVEMSDQWLIVEAAGKRVVIPHASILIIELSE